MSSGEKGWCVLNLHASTLAALAPEIIEYDISFSNYKPIGREIWQFKHVIIYVLPTVQHGRDQPWPLALN